MYFNGLDVSGFKSFADRLQIKFDNGMTAIVGPNGCGKSNVADAIRWVLGEQSSKSLRATNMQDVIFKGTEKRKSLSYAEVTLSFNNQDRFFNFDHDDLEITRKLYRSGESEYMLNNIPCRLKDIQNLLFDSGIGKDGYSIIGQGKVEQIIASKPEERRGIFEEAAGISKFKSKKIESERKLEKVRENMTRLSDILSELEKQVGPLKEQSEKAKQYLELRDILKDLETNIYIYQYENANTAKQAINERLSELMISIEKKENELEHTVNCYNNNMNQINNIDKTMNDLHDSILSLTVEIEKQSGQVRVIQERLNYLTDQNQKINKDINYINESKGKLITEKNDKINKISDSKTKLQRLQIDAKNVENEYLVLIDKLTQSEDDKDSTQQQMLDVFSKLSDIKSDSSRLKAEKKASEEFVEQNLSKLETIRQKLEAQEKLKEELKINVEKAFSNKQEIEKKYISLNLQIQQQKDEIEKTQLEFNNNSAKLQVYENKKHLLEEMQRNYDGYAGAVKKLLKESEYNPNIKNRMIGVLANLISTEKKYETAIETSLGSAVSNIVTHDENDAKYLIDILKENDFGRITFLPISTIRSRSISQDEKRRILSFRGVCGIASELVNYDMKIANVVSNLLTNTIISEDYNSAVSFAKQFNFGYRVVTLDGDVISTQGSITGGSRKSDSANILSREREIKDITGDIIKIKDNLTSFQKQFTYLKSSLQKNNEDLLDLQKQKSEADINHAKEAEKLDNIEFIIYDLNEDFTSLSDEISYNNKKIKAILAELSRVENLDSLESTNKEMVNKQIENHQKENEELRLKKDNLIELITSLKLQISSIEGEIDALSNDIERISFDIDEKQMAIDEYAEDLKRNEMAIDIANEQINSQINESVNSETRNKLKFLKSQLDNLDNEKLSIQAKIKDLDEQKSDLISNISHLGDRKHNEELNLAKVDTDIEQMQERIYEEYGLTYEGCKEFKRPGFALNEGMTQSNKIKKEINRLGYININAIEDYKSVSQRYEEMSSQVEDLNKSEEDLTKIIKELSKEMVDRFSTEFNKINENFKKTFKELFGGGTARLELTDSDDMLEAGIEIIAEPPGKKLQNLSLLSGGEKALTAIAILFAILKLKPLPFCLLDEIEAALDDSNVDRFAQYLKRFSNETQFIVITHRKPTMELADSLYGVTMEEKGVSKIVSVKLSEAVKNAETGDNQNGNN